MCTVCPLQFLESLCRGCPQLRRLSIAGENRNVTEQGLKHLAQLKQLKSLNVSFVDSVTDNTIAALSTLENLEVTALVSFI